MKKNDNLSLSRRKLITGVGLMAAGFATTACTNTPRPRFNQPRFQVPKFAVGVEGTGRSRGEYKRIYGAMPNEQFAIPAVDLDKVPEKYWRRRITYTGREKPGTLVVDTSSFYLYHVEEGGKAMRYGVGLGRQGFEWSGRANIAWKRAWPTWTPPAEMIEREPELEKYSADNGGMPPGLDNPLGARALYIHQDGVDTLYRIHGTPQYWTIGKAVSSGCVRMMNQDVIHLFDFVRNGSPIIVR